MTDLYSSLILDSQDNFNVTRRKGSDVGRRETEGRGKAPMDFGEEGMDFIESILSREEAEDVISMMINAKESQDCLNLPSFCTSSQVGGGELLGRATPSLAPPLSPILVGGDATGNEGYITSGRLDTDKKLLANSTERDQVRNQRNINSSFIEFEGKRESGKIITQNSRAPSPGTTAEAINRSSDGEAGCHDPDVTQGNGSEVVATFVAMENNVATGSVLIVGGGRGGESVGGWSRNEGNELTEVKAGTEDEGDMDEEEGTDGGGALLDRKNDGWRGKEGDVGTDGNDERGEVEGNNDGRGVAGSNKVDKEGGTEGVADVVEGAGADDKPDGVGVKDRYSSRLDMISEKMDLVEEILAMMGEKSTNLGSTVKNLEASLEFSQHEIENLKKENEDLKGKLSDLELEDKRTQFQTNLIEDKVDRLETVSKKKNLIFEGIPEVEGRREDVVKTIGGLFDQLAVHNGINFETCYRMGPYVKGRCRPILVSFERQADRDLLYARRMDLKKTTIFQRVWVNEDLGSISKKKRGVIRMIAREASLQGIDCRTGKYAIQIDNVRYDGSNLDELPPKLQLAQLKQVKVNETTLAYQSEHAPFSNFYTCQIKLGKHTFFCVEQAYHFVHAKTMNKHLAATKIYLSRDVRYIKQQGNELGTSPEWEGRQFDVMYACIKRKFEQNQELQDLLLRSGDLELVEATPDPLWGCGATLSSNVIRKKEWKGRNKQGEILMVVREELRRRNLKRQEALLQ